MDRIQPQCSAVVVRSIVALAASVILVGCGESTSSGGGGSSSASGFQQTNLVADVAGLAPTTDPNLVNPWGIAFSPTGPFWISDNHAGVSTVYDSNGKPFPTPVALVVTIPPPEGGSDAAAPTGIVFNASTDFVVTQGTTSAASVFIFATEDGTISGWNPTVNAGAALLTVDNSGDEAIYKGLATGSNAAGNLLFATDFHNGKVDVFDKTFKPVTLAGSFSDPNLPSGFAPFGIQNIGGSIFVTYAKQDEDAEDDTAGPGNGFVDVFDTNGNLQKRFASQGPLNSPWGVARAPASFGTFGNALLVGNFGDGRISAFNASSGAFLGQLAGTNGTPITIPGLWAVVFGNGGNAGSTSTLFFTAGPGGEEHGLFGSLQAVSE